MPRPSVLVRPEQVVGTLPAESTESKGATEALGVPTHVMHNASILNSQASEATATATAANGMWKIAPRTETPSHLPMPPSMLSKSKSIPKIPIPNRPPPLPSVRSALQPPRSKRLSRPPLTPTLSAPPPSLPYDMPAPLSYKVYSVEEVSRGDASELPRIPRRLPTRESYRERSGTFRTRAILGLVCATVVTITLILVVLSVSDEPQKRPASSPGAASSAP